MAGEILPVIWMEISSGEISGDLRQKLYHSSTSANAIEMFVIYGSLLVWVSSMTMIGLLIRRRRVGDPTSSVGDPTVHIGVEYQASLGGSGVVTLRLPPPTGPEQTAST